MRRAMDGKWNESPASYYVGHDFPGSVRDLNPLVHTSISESNGNIGVDDGF